MTPAELVAAIDSLSTFDLARLLQSPDFWDALGRKNPQTLSSLMHCLDKLRAIREAPPCLS